MATDLPLLIAAPGAPVGAKPGCPGDLRLDVEHTIASSWMGSCDTVLWVVCQAHSCYFSRIVPSHDASLERVYNEATRLHGKLAT